MGTVPAPVVNDVEFTEYEYYVIDGHATLSIPLGEKVVEDRSFASTLFDPEPDLLAQIEDQADHIIAEIEAHAPHRAPVSQETTATIVDINDARSRMRHPSRRSTNSGPARTTFTRRPLD
jgi:hypothetical protein